MTKIESFMQVKAFARQDGMLMALLWTASFACYTLLKAGAIADLLTISTPIFLAWRMSKFRDYALGGIISFRRGLLHGIYTFFYASLTFALVQFAYFQFLDNGVFAQTLCKALTEVTPLYEQSGIDKAQIDDAIKTINMLTPIQWAFMFMMQNFVVGVFTSLPIALICRRTGNAQKAGKINA